MSRTRLMGVGLVLCKMRPHESITCYGSLSVVAAFSHNHSAFFSGYERFLYHCPCPNAALNSYVSAPSLLTRDIVFLLHSTTVRLISFENRNYKRSVYNIFCFGRLSCVKIRKYLADPMIRSHLVSLSTRKSANFASSLGFHK